MREIKYEVWDEHQNKLIKWKDFNSLMPMISFSTHMYLKFMEYTGIHDDEDGNEIYEDYIVELIYEDETIKCTVKYEAGGFIFVSDNFDDGYLFLSEVVECDGSHFWIPNSKVIGNIYENADLLAVNEG